MNIILIFLIAISLSMDAFSLSLAYGTISLSKKDIKLVSIVVGLYHFFMPIIGMLLGKYITKFINIGEDIILLVIFTLIGINMILDSLKHKEKLKYMELSEILLFGFAVSIDSFSVGIGIKGLSNNFLIPSLMFSITSFLFTYIGLRLGKKLNLLIGRVATLIGGVSLVLLGIIYALT